MRTQTEITLNLQNLVVSQNLHPDPLGFVISVFLSCSRADTRAFKVNSSTMKINQTVKVKNIDAKQLEFWLTTTQNKIIAIGSLDLKTVEQSFVVDLKMLTTDFGRIQGTLDYRNYQIEKEIIIEPDEELLKKVQDPLEKKRKEQQKILKAKEAVEAAEAAKNVKKPAVTLSRFNKKDQPFI